jgi:hypothetical protein
VASADLERLASAVASRLAGGTRQASPLTADRFASRVMRSFASANLPRAVASRLAVALASAVSARLAQPERGVVDPLASAVARRLRDVTSGQSADELPLEEESGNP